MYLIYTNKNRSIIALDVINYQKINEIKNPHCNVITNFRHFLDTINNRDLVLSISEKECHIKLWDIKNFECLLDIKKIYEGGRLISACFLKENNQNYIITSKLNYSFESELIKVYDFNGKKIKSIPLSKDETVFIDSYYDNKLSKNFIFTCNKGHIKSFDFQKNKLYHKYYEKNNNKYHFSAVVFSKEIITKLIASCADGIIRIWNFHSGEILNKMKVVDRKVIYGICLWNNEYLFIGCEDKIIILNLEKIIIKKISGHNYKVVTIKKIKHPKYGECLLSQGYGKDGIKLWLNDY